MRIALISMHTSPAAVPGRGDAGGMNVVVSEAASALAARGHDVSVITRATAAEPAGVRPLQTGHPTGARLISIAAGDPDAPKEALPALVPDFSRAMISRFADDHAFDAVHAHYWLSGVAALPLAARSRVVPAITLHTVGAQKNALLAPGARPEPPLRLAAERAVVMRGAAVAVSRAEAAAIRHASAVPVADDRLVLPGVDTSTFHPRPRDVSRETPTTLRLTVLGRVQPLKGQDLAVCAAVALAQRDPELWSRTELIIAGEPTSGAEPFARQLRELARIGGIAKQVRFLPAQDRESAAQLLAESTLALVPSHSETFGLVALEAAASGTPVIAAAHTGLVEAAPDGVAGALVEGRDPEQWAAVIAALLRDPARLTCLRESARRHALSHDWSAHAAALERIYGSLRLT
ncbi:glycosyltransferase [Leucobacter musarum]|uniref:glycosyltransferase n=1 Tax=Leucobacter musarum TaxID=1930747 RepID=UPI000949A926|nr:glycosyltransferase [Leucobacter musarum]